MTNETDAIINKLFDEAIQYRDSGQFQLAIEKLNEILAQRPNLGSVLGVMGDVYWDMEDLPNAIRCFEKAVELLPKSELASLNLFHTLWESGNQEAAFSEMKRFLSIASSEEYNQLLKDMNQEQ